MPPKREMDFKALARELAEGSIVTQALARFIEQVIQELHETQIAPLRIRAEAAEASLASYKEEVERLREALERLAELTPSRANARDARDLHLTVKAIAETALTKEPTNAG